MLVTRALHETRQREAFAVVRIEGHEVELDAAITLFELELGIPATDALTRPPERLVEMVLSAFPDLEEKLTAHAR